MKSVLQPLDEILRYAEAYPNTDETGHNLTYLAQSYEQYSEYDLTVPILVDEGKYVSPKLTQRYLSVKYTADSTTMLLFARDIVYFIEQWAYQNADNDEDDAIQPPKVVSYVEHSHLIQRVLNTKYVANQHTVLDASLLCHIAAQIIAMYTRMTPNTTNLFHSDFYYTAEQILTWTEDYLHSVSEIDRDVWITIGYSAQCAKQEYKERLTEIFAKRDVMKELESSDETEVQSFLDTHQYIGSVQGMQNKFANE